MNRSEVINNLPEELSPLNIVDEIAAYKASDGILNWTELAFLALFESNEFAEYDKHGKGVITFYYKTLMDALRKVRNFEKRTFL